VLNGAVSLWLSKIISNFNPLNDKPLWFKVLNKQFDPIIIYNKFFKIRIVMKHGRYMTLLVQKCTAVCKHRFVAQLLQDPPM